MKKHSNKNSYILLGNVFSSKEYLLKKMKEVSVHTIGIFTSEFFLTNRDEKKSYDHCLSSTKNLLEDLKNIEEILGKNNGKLIFCLLCCEYDVEYLERLFFKLLPEKSNDPTSSNLRYQKHMMQESLKKNGMQIIKEILIEKSASISIDEQLKSIETFNYPVVMKPNCHGAAAEDVVICPDYKHLKNAIAAATKGFFKIEYTNLLVQEFIYGTQYFIDSCSLQGKHYFCGGI